MLEQLRPQMQEPLVKPARPTDDVPIAPRSQVKMLTDDGVKDTGVVAEEIPSGGGISQPDGATQPPETTEEQEALVALLDQHDEKVDAVAETPAPATTDEPAAPDFNAPEMQAFAEQFKKLMGVDLKEAFDNYNTLAAATAEIKQTQVQAELAAATTSLKDTWGVNDAELDRRVGEVLAYADKLPPALRAQYDSVEGIQLLWAQVEKRAAATPVNRVTGAPPSAGQQGSKQYRKSELYTMMQTQPGLYNKLQADIQRAFELGNVLDDM